MFEAVCDVHFLKVRKCVLRCCLHHGDIIQLSTPAGRNLC